MNFADANYTIQQFLFDQNLFTYSYDDKNYKLPTSDAIFCAEDTPRNRKFYEGLKASINAIKTKYNSINTDKNIVVVDAGSGTGILGIFAMLLGADKCIFIEQNPYSLSINKKLVEYFGFTNQSIYICDDANNCSLPSSFDILVSETIKSNFRDEDFPYIIENLQTYATNDFTIIPEKFDLEIYDSQKNFLCQEHISSYSMPIPYHLPVHKNVEKIYIKGTTYFFDDIQNYSGDCMSYFNELPLRKSDNSFLTR